jgi:hypothetical protein
MIFHSDRGTEYLSDEYEISLRIYFGSLTGDLGITVGTLHIVSVFANMLHALSD